MDVRYALAGLIVGTFVGFSGVGGSAILAPALILLLGVKPSLAIGVDLLYGVPTKIFAFALHQRQGNVDWPITRRLLAGGLPGAVGGLAMLAVLRAHVPPAVIESILRHAIGVAILLACAGVIVSWIVRTRGRALVANPRQPTVAVVAIGALVGFLVSVTSIGSGSITLPLLALALPAALLRRLIGSEIAFAAFLVPLAAAGHISFGDVSWPIVAALLAGSLPGVWIGSRLCALLGEGWLRPAIVGVLAIAGARLV